LILQAHAEYEKQLAPGAPSEEAPAETVQTV